MVLVVIVYPLPCFLVLFAILVKLLFDLFVGNGFCGIIFITKHEGDILCRFLNQMLVTYTCCMRFSRFHDTIKMDLYGFRINLRSDIVESVFHVGIEVYLLVREYRVPVSISCHGYLTSNHWRYECPGMSCVEPITAQYLTIKAKLIVIGQHFGLRPGFFTVYHVIIRRSFPVNHIRRTIVMKHHQVDRTRQTDIFFFAGNIISSRYNLILVSNSIFGKDGKVFILSLGKAIAST